MIEITWGQFADGCFGSSVIVISALSTLIGYKLFKGTYMLLSPEQLVVVNRTSDFETVLILFEGRVMFTIPEIGLLMTYLGTVSMLVGVFFAKRCFYSLRK